MRTPLGFPAKTPRVPSANLLERIDGLERFHDEDEGLHERRLIAVVVNRTGTAPLSAGTTPVRDYQDLLGRLDSAAHGGTTQQSAEDLWAECAAILRSLFLPPEIRHAELERLAQIAHPAPKDTETVLGLVSSPEHLRHFLGKVAGPAWLNTLGTTGALDPLGTDDPWPPHTAVARLAERHPNEVAAWLEAMYRSHGASPAAAAEICHAAVEAGGPSLSLVLTTVKDHQENGWIVSCGVRAAEKADASSALVEDLADVILNPNSWDAVLLVRPLLDQITAGVEEGNSQRRITLLVHKIRPLPDDDPLLRKLKRDRSGSIADTSGPSRDDRSRSLLSCLLGLLERASAWTPVSDLLDALDGLPANGLQRRLRAWVLANAPDVDSSFIVDEIEQAIPSRAPTGDDLALLDRAAADCDPSICASRWREALGAAPEVEQVGRALAANDVPGDWLRMRRMGSTAARRRNDIVGDCMRHPLSSIRQAQPGRPRP